jgi:hypothetical protein
MNASWTATGRGPNIPLNLALRRHLPSLCAALLLAAPSAHADALTPEVQVMGKTTLSGDTSGAIGPVVVADPGNPAHLVATSTAMAGGRPAALVHSFDGGSSWTGAGGTPPPYPDDGTGFPILSAGQTTMLWIAPRTGPRWLVYAEVARPFDSQATCNNNVSGIWASRSVDGGTWPLMGWIDKPGVGAGAILGAPRLAYDADTDKLVVVYERTNYATTDCTGSPTGHEVWMAWSNDDGASWRGPLRVSGNGRQPAAGVLPNGNVIVAYWDGGPIVAAAVCQTAGSGSCTPGRPVDVNVVDPGRAGGVEAHPRPDVAIGRDQQRTTRVVVSWSSRIAGISQVRTATSFDNGATFTAPGVAVPSATDQFDARLVAAQGTPYGRVDLAFLQDAGDRTVFVRTTASDTPPPGSGETWAPATRLEGTTTSLPVTAPRSPQGWLGITAAPADAAVRLVWTDSYTDVATDPSDIHGASLLHGTTAPTLSSASLALPADRASTVSLVATDADGDPLHYSIVSTSVGQASMQSPVQPQLVYTPRPGYNGPDTIVARVDDGVFSTTATLSILVGNSPPDISCNAVSTPENTPVQINLQSCVSDIDGDLVNITVTGKTHGQLNGSDTIFTPDPGFVGAASVSFRATDSRFASSSGTLTVEVQPGSVVQITVAQPLAGRRTVAVGQPVAFQAAASDDPNGKTHKVTWTFSDRTKPYPGPLVTRVFTKPGTVTATAMVTGLAPQRFQVKVVRPPLQLLSVKVTASRVVARLRANVTGTVELRLGHTRMTRKKLKASKTFTRTWSVAGRPRLRTMMLQARLKTSNKPPLPNPKLVRAVVLPLAAPRP